MCQVCRKFELVAFERVSIDVFRCDQTYSRSNECPEWFTNTFTTFSRSFIEQTSK
jgi:hypothetical protein